MSALVVYQSLYGATAAFAAAIAEGLGPDAVCVSTADAPPERVATARLLVVGAPVHIRSLPSEVSMRIADARPSASRVAPHPLLREWLATVPESTASAAAFDSRVAGRFTGSAAPDIAKALLRKGFTLVTEPIGFEVTDAIDTGASAPTVSDDEIARARAWGEALRDLGPWE